MHDNQIDDAGVFHLIGSLKWNATLAHLDLNTNRNITNQGNQAYMNWDKDRGNQIYTIRMTIKAIYAIAMSKHSRLGKKCILFGDICGNDLVLDRIKVLLLKLDFLLQCATHMLPNSSISYDQQKTIIPLSLGRFFH